MSSKLPADPAPKVAWASEAESFGAMMKLVALIALVLFGRVATAVTYASWLSSTYGTAFERTPLGAKDADLRRLAGDPA